MDQMKFIVQTKHSKMVENYKKSIGARDAVKGAIKLYRGYKAPLEEGGKMKITHEIVFESFKDEILE